MVALHKDSRIPQFLPSLSHMAVVKVVKCFFGDLLTDIKAIDSVYTGIQHGISQSFNEDSQDDHKVKRGQEKLLLIPAHLRNLVYKTMIGMSYDCCICFFYNIADEPELAVKYEIFFRFDGTVDRTKMAKSFVGNESVDIRLRFHVACLHCFEENVVSLWKEMEACGETKKFDSGNKLMTNLWVKWIQERSQIPWLQAFKEYFKFPPALSAGDRILIRPFFTLLHPEERDKFFPYLMRTDNYDDFRFCLHAANKQEEVKILQNDLTRFLVHHLNWPLQGIFLEVAEMVWHFLDVSSFNIVLMLIWDFQRNYRDYDYCQLFLDFWYGCPLVLRETVKEYPAMRKKIYSILNKLSKRKRKSSDTNKKKWIRRSGRLESKS